MPAQTAKAAESSQAERRAWLLGNMKDTEYQKAERNTSCYEDIIHLPHHASVKHPPMPVHDRAAQFSPFAALTGYQDIIEEETRINTGEEG